MFRMYCEGASTKAPICVEGDAAHDERLRPDLLLEAAAAVGSKREVRCVGRSPGLAAVGGMRDRHAQREVAEVVEVEVVPRDVQVPVAGAGCDRFLVGESERDV